MVEKIEEEEAVRMRCCGCGLGGWVGFYLPLSIEVGGWRATSTISWTSSGWAWRKAVTRAVSCER